MSANVRIRNGMAPSAGSGGASEGDIRGVATDIIVGGGVVDVVAGQLLVHQSVSPDMNVIVDAGVAYVPNASFDMTDSDQVRFWEAVVNGTTGSRTLAVGSNSSGSTRIDIICVKIDTGATPNSTASNVASLLVVAGTPGAGVPATPSNYLKLAQVTVANGASSLANAVIADSRTQVKFNHNFFPIKRVTTVTSSSTPTPNVDTDDIYNLSALAASAAFAAPTGTPTDGQTLVIRIKDNATARSLSWNSIYRAIGVFLPSTTTISKMIYVGCIYNATAVKWDVVAVNQEF